MHFAYCGNGTFAIGTSGRRDCVCGSCRGRPPAPSAAAHRASPPMHRGRTAVLRPYVLFFTSDAAFGETKGGFVAAPATSSVLAYVQCCRTTRMSSSLPSTESAVASGKELEEPTVQSARSKGRRRSQTTFRIQEAFLSQTPTQTTGQLLHMRLWTMGARP